MLQKFLRVPVRIVCCDGLEPRRVQVRQILPEAGVLGVLLLGGCHDADATAVGSVRRKGGGVISAEAPYGSSLSCVRVSR